MEEATETIQEEPDANRRLVVDPMQRSVMGRARRRPVS
jgi:hypothetical protein